MSSLTRTAALIAAMTLASSAIAEEHPTWTLSGTAMHADPDDDDRLASSGTGFLLGVGYYFNPRWSVDFEYDDYDFEQDEGGDLDVDSLGVMFRHHFAVDGRLKPYLGFGAGQADHSSSRGGGDNFMAQAAGGFHYPMTDRLNFRGELRWRFDADRFTVPDRQDRLNDWFVHVGVQFALGTTGSDAGPEPATSSDLTATSLPDSDGDGVPNNRDRCPNTPRGVEVNEDGCPPDSDNDGVPDYRDDCPDTPAGREVGPNGCEKQVLIELPSVFFDFDKATLKPEARRLLGEAIETLTENDVIRVSVEGHTDFVGTEAYNIRLSERRAKAVYEHLESNGVDASRMNFTGYGEARPIATNETEEGRARNRRVEIRIVD